MPNWVDFKNIRARVSLEDVIVRYYRITTLKQIGSRLIGPCPVHGGDSPRAFHAEIERNIWKCFTRCPKDKSGGNQIDFVAYKEGISVRDAALRLQEFFLGDSEAPAPVAAPTSREGAATRSMPAPPPLELAARAKPVEGEAINPPLDVRLHLKHDHPHLLQDRGLSRATVEHFGIGWCGKGIFRGTIAIPIHNEHGQLVAYAGRRLKPADMREFGKYKLPKGFRKDHVLYNFHRATENFVEPYVILVEGFFSVAKLYEFGFSRVVAAMGSELSVHQAQLLAGVEEVIVIFDCNPAGWQGAAAARELLAAVSPATVVRVIHLPLDCEPESLSGKALRWAVNGMRQLDLAELSFSSRDRSPTNAT